MGERRASPTGRTTRSSSSRSSRSSAARSTPPTAARCWRRTWPRRAAARRSTSAATRPGRSSRDIVGYSTQTRNRTGLEQSYNDFLTGSNANLDTVFRSALDKLQGTTVTGNDLVLDDPAERAGAGAAAAAWQVRRGRRARPADRAGARDGDEPDLQPEPDREALRRRHAHVPCRAARRSSTARPPGSIRRARRSRWSPRRPRSTREASRPTRPFNDPGYCEEYGKQVRNAGNPEAPETFGHVNLATGFQHSINSVFCNVGKTLGAGRRARVREALRLLLAAAARDARRTSAWRAACTTTAASSTRSIRTRRSIPAASRSARSGLPVTPLQMAMVAAAIANHGAEMRPQIVERIVSPGRQDDHAPAARPARPADQAPDRRRAHAR